jgi:hypothetical protein
MFMLIQTQIKRLPIIVDYKPCRSSVLGHDHSGSDVFIGLTTHDYGKLYDFELSHCQPAAFIYALLMTLLNCIYLLRMYMSMSTTSL